MGETPEQQPCEDSDYLGPIANATFRIGAVYEVNGKGAVEVPSFAPTRHELFQLAKYWIERELDIRFSWFIYDQTGSTEIRVRPFARRRTERIAQVLGEEAIAEAKKHVADELGAKEDPALWQMFLDGQEPVYCKLSHATADVYAQRWLSISPWVRTPRATCSPIWNGMGSEPIGKYEH